MSNLFKIVSTKDGCLLRAGFERGCVYLEICDSRDRRSRFQFNKEDSHNLNDIINSLIDYRLELMK